MNHKENNFLNSKKSFYLISPLKGYSLDEIISIITIHDSEAKVVFKLNDFGDINLLLISTFIAADKITKVGGVNKSFHLINMIRKELM